MTEIRTLAQHGLDSNESWLEGGLLLGESGEQWNVDMFKRILEVIDDFSKATVEVPRRF